MCGGVEVVDRGGATAAQAEQEGVIFPNGLHWDYLPPPPYPLNRRGPLGGPEGSAVPRRNLGARGGGACLGPPRGERAGTRGLILGRSI